MAALAAKETSGLDVISANSISFRIDTKVLLDQVRFELRRGEVLAVLGPNGAGKSTLLKCLASQHRPASGSITVGEHNLAELPPREVARWRAVLPQSGQIPFAFTAEEIVMLGRSPHAHTGNLRHDHEITRAALARTDALHLIDRTANTLSGGELQRVHMARVLAQIWEPVETPGRLLLLDEPTASLDLQHQHALMALARDLAAEGVAVFVVLHDLNLAAAYADRVLVMESGRCTHAGSPSEVLVPETVRSVFGVRSHQIELPGERHPFLLVPSQTSEPGSLSTK